MKQRTPWRIDYARVSTVEPSLDDTYRLQNVRNFSYHSQQIAHKEWRTYTVRPHEVKRVWYYVAPLMNIGWFKELFAHTFLAFEFTTGPSLAFSIEARRRENQPYNPFTLGMIGAYELTYLWGTLDDFETRRTVLYGQPIDRYPLTLSTEKNAALMRGLFADTNAVAENPRSYHSLTTQCTNELIRVLSTIHSQALPWHLHWHLTTLSPRTLARYGIINDTQKEQLLVR